MTSETPVSAVGGHRVISLAAVKASSDGAPAAGKAVQPAGARSGAAQRKRRRSAGRTVRVSTGDPAIDALLQELVDRADDSDDDGSGGAAAAGQRARSGASRPAAAHASAGQGGRDGKRTLKPNSVFLGRLVSTTARSNERIVAEPRLGNAVHPSQRGLAAIRRIAAAFGIHIHLVDESVEGCDAAGCLSTTPASDDDEPDAGLLERVRGAVRVDAPARKKLQQALQPTGRPASNTPPAGGAAGAGRSEGGERPAKRRPSDAAGSVGGRGAGRGRTQRALGGKGATGLLFQAALSRAQKGGRKQKR